MDRDFFVMLNTQNGECTPLMDDDELALYQSESEARTDAAQSVLGNAFGFEIFELGTGAA